MLDKCSSYEEMLRDLSQGTAQKERYGMQVNPGHCRWHSAFVDSGLFDWCCEKDGCVIKHAQGAKDPGDLLLDKTMTISKAIELIGPLQWDVIKDSPEEVYQALSRAADQSNKNIMANHAEENDLYKEAYWVMSLTKDIFVTDDSQQIPYETGARHERGDGLIMETIAYATRDLDLGPDWCEAVRDIFGQLAPQDAATGMVIAQMIIVFVHMRHLQKFSQEANCEDLGARVDLLCKLSNQYLKLYAALNKGLRGETPKVQMAVERFMGQLQRTTC